MSSQNASTAKSLRTFSNKVLLALRDDRLSVEEALSIAREHSEAAERILHLSNTMLRFPESWVPSPTGVSKDSFHWKVLEIIWAFYGPDQCLSHEFRGEGSNPVVNKFVHYRLTNNPEKFSDSNLEQVHKMFHRLRELVTSIQYTRIANHAHELQGQPREFNEDVEAVKQHVRNYDFPPELNKFLEKVEQKIDTATDDFDYKTALELLRSFVEHLHRITAERTQDAERPFKKNAAALSYLWKQEGISNKLLDLGNTIYAFLSESGSHALRGSKEHVRLGRNMVVEYALAFLAELANKLGDNNGGGRSKAR